MKRSISQMLEAYTGRALSPWHMPGHKRKALLGGMWDEMFRLDVTEVPGTDDLHHATGAILESERAAAAAVGAAYCHYLVGGSTAGILAAVSAAAKLWRERISGASANIPVWAEGKTDLAKEEELRPIFLVAANCHKSVWNGLRLVGARIISLEPEGDPVYGPVSSETLLRTLSEEVEDSEQVAGCIITSPTYGGSFSPLGELHAVLQVYGIPLIVDEAHGAHLPFCEEMAWHSGVGCGAEYVIASLHKTLPALTQTAVLYVGSDSSSEESSGSVTEEMTGTEAVSGQESGTEEMTGTEAVSGQKSGMEDMGAASDYASAPVPALNRERLEAAVAEQLAVFQSSSPSYILMLSAEEALVWADENRESFDRYIRRMEDFREELSEELNNLKLTELPGTQDPTRLLFRCSDGAEREETSSKESSVDEPLSGAVMTGPEMADWLERCEGIVVELAGSREIILISTVCDEEADLQRLKEALLRLDAEIAGRKKQSAGQQTGGKTNTQEPSEQSGESEHMVAEESPERSGEALRTVAEEPSEQNGESTSSVSQKSVGQKKRQTRRRRKAALSETIELSDEPGITEVPDVEPEEPGTTEVLARKPEESGSTEEPDEEPEEPGTTEVLVRKPEEPASKKAGKKRVDSSKRLPRVGDFVQRDIYVYPPGIPILRAGERVTEDALRKLQEVQTAGLRIYGL